MKRWQDRGEVLDSDDEEFGLSNDSQSPEQARKRVKLGDDSTNLTGSRTGELATSGKHDGEAEEDELWLQPKVATTYTTKKVMAVEIDVPIQSGLPDNLRIRTDFTNQEPTVPAQYGENEPEATLPDAEPDSSENGASSSSLPKHPKDDLLLARSERSRSPLRLSTESVHTTAETSKPAETDLFAGPFSSPLSDGGNELPNASQLLGDRILHIDNADIQEDDNSSGLSSPLTELSPSPPPGFRMPTAYLNPATLNPVTLWPTTSNPTVQSPDHDLTARSLEDGMLAASILQAQALDAPGGRRLLRDRKEKQLHPYAFEKTAYQQQMRQRGIRPVHFTVRDNVAVETETQDHTFSGNGSESQQHDSESQQQLGDYSSSPIRPSSGSARHAVTGAVPDRSGLLPNADSDDEFPDIDIFLKRGVPGTLHEGHKRRKLAHLKRVAIPRNDAALQAQENLRARQQDDFSVPLSPPPTSSDSVQQARSRVLPSGFRLPMGMTPAPLPTPHVSSDLRPSHRVDHDSGSDAEGLPRRTRISAMSFAAPGPTHIESSAESESDAAPQPEADDRRLFRERKRIRGVLPASWLKIDLRAQHRRPSLSPDRLHRLEEESPPPSIRQKGVAQRVPRAFGTPARANIVEIPDDGDDSDNTRRSRSPPVSRQPRLQFPSTRSVRAETADIDRMEMDWIDPMFAGSSRQSKPGLKARKRQPRIRDAFARVQSERHDFSEERIGMKNKFGPAPPRKRPSGHGPRQSRRSAPPVVALGILDAPSSPTDPGTQVPQFVRLAQRQARQQPGHGRHSPTSKNIRLSTAGETDEANAVLRAWRSGTIAPRPVSLQTVRKPAARPTYSGGQESTSTAARQTLMELSNNQRAHLPSPLRKEAGRALSSTARRIVVRRAGLQQTTLGTTDDLHQTSHGDASVTPKQRPKHRVQPQSLHLRRAQLETLEAAYAQERRTSAFERRINCLTETVTAQSHRSSTQALPLARFLEPTPVRVTKTSAPRAQERADRPGEDHTDRPRITLPYRARKRHAQHVDVEARQYRQPSEPLPEVSVIEVPSPEVQGPAGPVLRGLESFGTKYAIDFDIHPLTLGTYFHHSTFIGSGDFAASLDTAHRDFSTMRGSMTVHVGEDVLEWGVWTEEVAASFGQISGTISGALATLGEVPESTESAEQVIVVTSNIDHMLRSNVRYSSRCLTFSDPVDRRSCVQHLQRLVEDLLEISTGELGVTPTFCKLRTKSLSYALVIATQAYQLSQDVLVSAEIQHQGQTLVIAAATKLSSHLLPSGLTELRTLYEDSRHSSKRELGIRDDDAVVAGMVILHHCLRTVDVPKADFWTVVNAARDIDIGMLDTVAASDGVWYDILTVLPVLEFDDRGIARPGSRLDYTQQNWTVIKQLLGRLFELYHASVAVRGSTMNDYVRAALTRCYRLISRWGWWKCEAVLGSIFDFFARRNLAPLDNEESQSSPRFLEELRLAPSLEVQPHDRSFHILLKTLAVGLLGMRTDGRYSNSKIGSIAWRFIPNHGRPHRKDADVRQTDMDALRNHHDLLCTLYFASPAGHRHRLELLRELVDHSTSHREACRLSVRSWSNLTSYQASTDEHADALQPFTTWFRDILQTTIGQYRLAKTEAEHDFAVAKAQGTSGLTDNLLTATIAGNQRQIAATLVDALAGLGRALRSANNLPAATALVEGTRFWTMFTPFDASERRLAAALTEALNVAEVALELERELRMPKESQHTSEDSQDYGDSTALHEFATTQNPSNDATTIPDLLLEPIGQLLSNIFGADDTIDDATLVKLVDIWVQLALESVRARKRSWASYLDEYSANSWHQLRATEQKRKYTPYFLASVVKHAGGYLDDLKTDVLTAWLVSLVDREATLKYQHELTAALRDNIADEPLLSNMPFGMNYRTDVLHITLLELRQRRLALISSVLHSMRNDFDEALYARPGAVTELRKRYSDMLKAAMQAMKGNYQDLQASSTMSFADPNIHGAYVEFVQHIVSSLQEHTADICRVDPFFTDSSAFPLPSTDPTYVVGRLRGYVPKLGESKTRKLLATFIHTVSERAAVDGQQPYLVDQLCSAMNGVTERGSNNAPTLRHVVLTSILPAYIENALSTSCSWILSLPLLQACGRVFTDMLYNVVLENEESVRGVVVTLEVVLATMHQLLEQALSHPGLLQLPHVQRLLGLFFTTSRSALTLCKYLQQTTGSGRTLASGLSDLHVRGQAISAFVSGSHETVLDPVVTGEKGQSDYWADTKSFTQTYIRNALEKDWYAHDGQYFVKRGNTSKEVVVALGDEEEERNDLLASIEGFSESFGVIMGGQDTRRVDTMHSVAELIV